MTQRSWQKRDSDVTHYEVLGLKNDCSQEDVKKAFVELSKEHHPDVPGGCVERSKRINVAYTTLSKVEDRKKYDLELERMTWKPNPVEEYRSPTRRANPGEVHNMYGFPSQANYSYSGRHPKNLLVAFGLFMGAGIFASFFLTYRDRIKALKEDDAPTGLDSANYLNGDIVARRAALSHRRVRDRARKAGTFDEQLRFVEGAVLKKPVDNVVITDPTPNSAATLLNSEDE